MKKIISLITTVIFVCLLMNNGVCTAADVDTSIIEDEDMNLILQAINDSELEDGEEVDVDGRYTIYCAVETEELNNKARDAYSTTRSKTLTYNVVENSGNKVVFTFSQTVVAVFNTYSEQAKIMSHTVSFSSSDSSYKMVSATQVSNINTWGTMVPGKLYVVISHGSAEAAFFVSTLVTYCDKFSFSLNAID